MPNSLESLTSCMYGVSSSSPASSMSHEVPKYSLPAATAKSLVPDAALAPPELTAEAEAADDAGAAAEEAALVASVVAAAEEVLTATTLLEVATVGA